MKFVQLEAVATKEGHTLYALDDSGAVFMYDGPARRWIACGTERIEPRPVGHG